LKFVANCRGASDLNLLLIESERNSSGWLADRLPEYGFVPRRVASLELGMRNGMAQQAKAVIVELEGAVRCGPDFARFARNQGLEQPLVLLAAHGGWRDRVDSLDAGADDFMIKPVRVEEIAARLRMILRRGAGSAGDRVVAGGIAIDLKARTAQLDGRALALTRHEFRLLRVLLLQADQVISHSEIHDQLYAHDRERTMNAVEVHIARLRRKLGMNMIRSVRGVGYMLVTSDSMQ